MNVNQSDIFYTNEGDFFQVIKVSNQLITVRPIARKCLKIIPLSAHDGIRIYEPCPYVFSDSFVYWSPEQCIKGRRCRVLDFTIDRSRPQIRVTEYIDAFLLTDKVVEVDYYG